MALLALAVEVVLVWFASSALGTIVMHPEAATTLDQWTAILFGGAAMFLPFLYALYAPQGPWLKMRAERDHYTAIIEEAAHALPRIVAGDCYNWEHGLPLTPGQLLVFATSWASANFSNCALIKDDRTYAKDVQAEVYVYQISDLSRPFRSIHGLWAQGLSTITLPPNELSFRLLVAVKNKVNDDCYLVSHLTEWGDDRFRVPPGMYPVKIVLKGIAGQGTHGVVEVFNFYLQNFGANDRVHLGKLDDAALALTGTS